MARFPHEFTMKKYHLLESDLNDDANDALQDFEQFLSHLTDLKSKAGDSWKMTQAQQKKLNRLSRSVCTEIEYMVEDAPATSETKASTPDAKEPNQTQEEESSIFDIISQMTINAINSEKGRLILTTNKKNKIINDTYLI